MKELKKERTEFSKVYDIGNNQRKMVACQLPLHIKTKTGRWTDITFEIKNRKVTKSPYKARLLKDKIGYYAELNGKAIEMELLNTKKPTPQIEENCAVWKNVTPGVDVVIQFGHHGVIFSRIVRRKNARKTFIYRIKKENDLIADIQFGGVDSKNKELQLEQKEISKRQIKSKNRTFEEQIVSDTFMGKVVTMNKKTRKRSWSKKVKYPICIK